MTDEIYNTGDLTDAIDQRRHSICEMLYVKKIKMADIAQHFERSPANLRDHAERYLRQGLSWIGKLMVDRVECEVFAAGHVESVEGRFYPQQKAYLADCLHTITRSRYTEITTPQ